MVPHLHEMAAVISANRIPYLHVYWTVLGATQSFFACGLDYDGAKTFPLLKEGQVIVVNAWSIICMQARLSVWKHIPFFECGMVCD
jgi:hypothetical protein